MSDPLVLPPLARRLAAVAPLLAWVAVAAAPSRPAHAAIPTRCAGVQVPARVTVADTALTLNGLGLRTVSAFAFTVKVYVAALYREEPSADPVVILEERRPWRLVLHFVRDVDRDRIIEGFEEGIRREGSDAGYLTPAFTQHLADLKAWMPDVSEGEALAFTYRPGAGMRVVVDGKTMGTIEDDSFARTFLAIWLGSVPPNPELKQGLLGGACG